MRVLSSSRLPVPSCYHHQQRVANIGHVPHTVTRVHQLKGLRWLVSLFDQGINGILADEMGLGKTVQSIAMLAHLVERENIWGPFLVVAPSSTLHNWEQELRKFVPTLKVCVSDRNSCCCCSLRRRRGGLQD